MQYSTLVILHFCKEGGELASCFFSRGSSLVIFTAFIFDRFIVVPFIYIVVTEYIVFLFLFAMN